MSYDDWKLEQPDDSYYAEAETETEINELLNPKNMDTLNYQIQNYLEQAKRISQEYPQIDKIEYTIKDASYKDVKQIADEAGKEVSIGNGKGLLLISEGIGYVFIWTKPLIVSEPIIVEG
jgi:hypothetical protein